MDLMKNFWDGAERIQNLRQDYLTTASDVKISDLTPLPTTFITR